MGRLKANQQFNSIKSSTTSHRTFLKYRNHAECLNSLNSVLDCDTDIAIFFQRGVTTHYNKVFHGIKTIIMSKNINFGNSTDLRQCASILQYNDIGPWLAMF